VDIAVVITNVTIMNMLPYGLVEIFDFGLNNLSPASENRVSELVYIAGTRLCFELKYAFADIHKRRTERMVAPRCCLTLTLKKPTEFCASANHSKRKKPLTPPSESKLTVGAPSQNFHKANSFPLI
jgi:hypothetical protein